MEKLRAGIDIGATKTALGIFSANKELLCRGQFATPSIASHGQYYDLLFAAIGDCCRQAGLDAAGIEAIGAGAPGWIDHEAGTIVHLPHVAGFDGMPLKAALEERFGVSAAVDNDANAAALAEYTLGAGRGFPHMIYATVSTGIGAGLILGGRLYRGAYGFAGEIGHMIATPEAGVACGCGNRGCFDSWAGGAHIAQHIEARLAAGESTMMNGLCGGDISAANGETLKKALAAGDAMAEELTAQMGEYLGTLYYNIYLALNINCIVMGGGLLKLGSAITDAIRERFDALLCMQPLKREVYIKPAELGDDFGIIGAALLTYENKMEAHEYGL